MEQRVSLWETGAKQRRRRTIKILGLLVLVLVLSILISIGSGYTKLSPGELLNIFFGEGTAKERMILLKFRMPRIVLSMLVGMGFALSGCIIQGVTKNPLADPGLMGINAGAGFMVVIFVVATKSTATLGVVSLPFLALIGASAAAVMIYLLAYRSRDGISPIRLILNGVALQAGIGAVMTLLIIKMDEREFEFVAAWQAGSIWSSTWKYVLVLLPWLLIGMVWAFSKARSLDLLSFGNELAIGLGSKVNRERFILLAIAVGLAASSVSVSGNISFIGMIAPHLARQLVGPKHGILLPASALVGGVLVVISDTLARVIVQPASIPTGIVVAVLGAPYFVYLMVKNSGH